MGEMQSPTITDKRTYFVTDSSQEVQMRQYYFDVSGRIHMEPYLSSMSQQERMEYDQLTKDCAQISFDSYLKGKSDSDTKQ